MTLTETRALPNASDKAALKAIATRIIQTCPSLQDCAREVASDLLKKYAISGHDPDNVYFHRFDAAQSSSKTFTGWEHVHAVPTSSMTLTQLVIQRFRVGDQDNADLLDVYAGFYSVGTGADTYNETNEVRLHGNDVLKDFWSINFSELYTDRLTGFWEKSGTDFRTLAKCNFLISAVRARDKRQLSDEDFQFVTDAAIGPVTWPVTLQLLQAEHTGSDCIGVLDIASYVSTHILRFTAPQGRHILYLPGETDAFQTLQTTTDLHYWVLERMNKEDARQTFMTHFSLADRQAISSDITNLMNRLVSTWGRYDHHLINQTHRSITGDAFTWLRDSTKTAMFAEAELSLTSNGDLRKKLWIGYLSAGMKVFSPMAVVGWPVALPVIGASIASLGLNIDQAVNGKTHADRKAGVLGAVLAGIDLLFNLAMLKGSGLLEDIDPKVDLAEAKEMAELKETAAPPVQQAEGRITPPVSMRPLPDTIAVDSSTESRDVIPQNWMANEVLDDLTPNMTPGKFQGIHSLDSNPATAILLDDCLYYVRYEPDLNGGGTWAIIDPEQPNAFSGSIPVRLNDQGEWEVVPRGGLKGGGNAHPGRSRGAPRAPTQATPASRPARRSPSPSTQYDTHNSLRLRKLALGEHETHIKLVRQPDGTLKGVTTFEEYVAARRINLSRDGRLFFSREGLQRSLPPRPDLARVRTSTSTQELIREVFDVAPGLVVGESQDRIASMQFLIENMPTLAAQKVETLYFHRLLNDFSQADLDQFFTTGEMSDDLATYLQNLESDPAGRFTPLEVVKTARHHGIRVQATDCLASYRFPDAPMPDMQEQAIKTYLTHTIMEADKALNGTGKWVVLTNQENVNTFRGMPGISEMQGGVGLRIEEVLPEQQVLIEPDRGIAVAPGFATRLEVTGDDALENTVEDTSTLYADMSLQTPLPLIARTPEELERLLIRQGMFTFEESEDNWTLIHRSRNQRIVRTPIERTAGGGYMINRASWPEVDHIGFASIEQLFWALSRMGMVMEGRMPV